MGTASSRSVREKRILGHDHPVVLAADRIHDDHLYRRPAGSAGGYARGGQDRRREQVGTDQKYHDPFLKAHDHHAPDPLGRAYVLLRLRPVLPGTEELRSDL